MDNIILNKISTIEKCLARIQEEYKGHEKEISSNYTKQDAIILNLQRVCEASIDLGNRVILLKKLGLPQSSREVFQILEKEKIIGESLSKNMQHMVGFRNIAVHDYQILNLEIIVSILEKHLSSFNELSSALLHLK